VQKEAKLKNTHDNFYEAWSEDFMFQVQWKSDNLGDLKCFLKDFDKIQNGGKSNMAQMTS